MRYLAKGLSVLFLVFFINHFGYTQSNIEEIGNFRFDKQERKVFWVKVFEPKETLDLTSIKQYFTENQILEVFTEDSSSFAGKFIPKPIDIQKYGYKRGTTPMFLLDVEQIFNVKVEFKEGRYRTSLSQMGYIDNGVISDLTNRALVGKVPTSAKGNIVLYEGEFSFTNKNEVRTRNQTGFEILDKFYSDVLTFREKEKMSSDW